MDPSATLNGTHHVLRAICFDLFSLKLCTQIGEEPIFLAAIELHMKDSNGVSHSLFNL